MHRPRPLKLACVCFLLLCVRSATGQVPPAQAPPALGAPANLDFQKGAVGGPPDAWLIPGATSGFTARLGEQGPTPGGRALLIRYEGKESPSDTGNLRQRIAGAQYRNGVVRLRADVRVEPGDNVYANLFLRDELPRGSARVPFVDEAFPINAGEWQTYEVSGAIDEDAETVIFGIRLHGSGAATIRNVSFDIVGPVDPVRERSRPLSAHGLANLTAFARLFGYVRHFHPSDQAVRANWMAVAIAGVESTEGARDSRELASRLEALFRPIAPTVRVLLEKEPLPPPNVTAPAGGATTKLISWKHRGAYRAERILTDVPPGGALPPLFVAGLGGGIKAVVPLSLLTDAGGTLPHVSMPSRPWYRHDANDRAVRLADVVIAWNILQHFYPYFDVVKTDWPGALSAALTSAAAAPDADAFGITLGQLVAALHDGHGQAFPSAGRGVLALSLTWVEEALVIADADPHLAPGVARGDAVTAINGRPIAEWRRETARRLSAATPQFMLLRLQAEVVWGAVGERVVLEIEPFDSPGTRRRVTLERREVADPADRPIEIRPDKVAELRPGVLYVDLTRLSNAQEWQAALPKMQQASAVIFDMRGYPSLAEAFLRNLFDKPFTSAQFRTPIITEPDGKGRAFEDGHWNMTPLAPYVSTRKIFLTDARAISYAESVMGIIENYRIGDIVGGPTAGTNGNAVMTDLPGGYGLIWTGMQVLKHDGSQHHGVGILPTVPVSRTRAGIAAGRDEVLERALALLK